MIRSQTPSFIVTRAIQWEQWVDDKLTKKFNAANRLYNAGVKHCIHNMEAMQRNEQYSQTLEEYRDASENGDLERRKELAAQLNAFREAYGLTEYEIQRYLGKGYQQAYKGCLGANIVQKIATSLSVPVGNALFTGSKIHYRRFGETNSFEDKSAVSGIIYKPEEDAVYINRTAYKLVPVRKTDTYLQKAMTCRIKYCRIIRKPFHNGYHYFVQFIMEGHPPVKDKHLYPTQVHEHTLGIGVIGVDEGTSDCAYYGKNAAGFRILAEGVERYNAEIQKCAQIYERRVRKNNPDCYNRDGTRIKGKKNYCHTKGMAEALMWLKDAHRRKSVFVRQEHNILANEIASNCDTIVKEPMNFHGLAKRSKAPPERQDKESTVTDKKGNAKKVRKFKKKRGFGKSINNRSPGGFNQILEDKIIRLGGTCFDVDKNEYKASQYNHLTREATKPKLSERTKWIGDKLVQRDLYSAFLLSEMKDEKTIDFDKCNRDFDHFLKQQEQIISELKSKPNPPRNFGLKDFSNTTS